MNSSQSEFSGQFQQGGFPNQPQQGGFPNRPPPNGFPNQPTQSNFPNQPQYGHTQQGGFTNQPQFVQPHQGGFPNRPPPTGFPNQPQYVQPQQGGFPNQPQFVQPQQGGFPNRPPQTGFPNQPQYGQPQQGGFPNQPQYGHPQQGGFPNRPPPTGFPNQPQYGQPQQGGFPNQPQQGGFPNQPQQNSFPNQIQQGVTNSSWQMLPKQQPVVNLKGDMREHLEQIMNMITDGVKFGVIRPNDGEYSILENKQFTSQLGDDWTNYSNGVLRKQLLNAIQTKRPNLFIGIPCDTCDDHTTELHDNYINKYCVSKSQLTYANVFCNSNWPIFTNFLKSYKRGFYLVTMGTKPCDFPIRDRCIIDKYLVNKWDKEHEKETNRIINYVRGIKNELICFAAGPLSKIWIPLCMEFHPYNTYLDIGSAMDLYTKGEENRRPYTYQEHEFAKRCCKFKALNN